MGGTADKPKPPVSPEAAKAAPLVTPKTLPNSPRGTSEAIVTTNKEIAARRKKYQREVSPLLENLMKVVEDSKISDPVKEEAAKREIVAFVGQVEAELEAYDHTQSATFKVQKEIGGIFNIQVSQGFDIGGDQKAAGPEAKPSKLNFKVAIEPLGVTLGYAQSVAGEGGPQRKTFMDIDVFEDKVTVSFEREQSGEDTTYSGTLGVDTGAGIYGGFGVTMPGNYPGESFSGTTLNVLAAMELGEEQPVNIGAYLDLTPSGSEAGAAGGLSIMAPF